MDSQGVPITREVFARFVQLEDIERRQKEASGFTADLFRTAQAAGETIVRQLCADPIIRSSLLGQYAMVQKDVEQLTFLARTDLVDPAKVEAVLDDFKKRRIDPILRLVPRFLGGVTTERVENEIPSQKSEAVESLADDEKNANFLLRPPEIVAKELIGQKLVFKSAEAVIIDAKGQNGEYNQRFRNRPIFGTDRVDVYIASSHALPIMFIRAGDNEHTDCCVKIVGISLDGVDYYKPSHVCKALGLDAEQIGKLEISDHTITIKELKKRRGR